MKRTPQKLNGWRYQFHNPNLTVFD